MARIIYPVTRRLKSLPQGHILVGCIQNPVKNGVDRLKTILQQGHGVVIDTKGNLISPQVEQSSSGAAIEIDDRLSVVACCYRLMTFFPTQFPNNNEPDDDDSNHSLWGHHHDNWQAALITIKHFRNFRSKANNQGKIDKALKKGSTIPQKPELQAPLWYGKTTSAVNINAARAVRQGEGDAVSIWDTTCERDGGVFANLAGSRLEGLTDVGTEAEIEQLLGVTLGPDAGDVRSNGEVTKMIEDKLQRTFNAFAPGIDMQQSMSLRPDAPLPEPLQPDDIGVLCGWLDDRAMRVAGADDGGAPEAATLARQLVTDFGVDDDDRGGPGDDLIEACEAFGLPTAARPSWESIDVPILRDGAQNTRPHQLTGNPPPPLNPPPSCRNYLDMADI